MVPPAVPVRRKCRRPMTAEEALTAIGRDPEARAAIVAALKAFERLPGNRFTTVRDDITGPVVDALHAGAGTLRKQLSNGLIFEFPYRSKIARDFVMSAPERPDHVWEPQTTRLLVRLSRDATHALVGGAYFGDQAIPIAHAMRGRGTCHAFEPDADQAAMVARNAALNGLDNVRVQPLGLWSDSATRLAFVGTDALAATVAAEGGIPATTIDEYAGETGIDRLGLIMLDLEGAELEVLKGASRILDRDRPAIVFEVHGAFVDWSQGLARTDIVRFLSARGYTVLAVRDFQSNVALPPGPIELVPIETAWLEGPPHGFNLVALPDPRLLEDPLFRIAPGVSPKLLFHRDPALHHPTGGL